MKDQKGFSLIEILVVFTIIGLLSVAAASSYQSAQIKARDSMRKSDLANIKASLELAKSDHPYSYYPMWTGCVDTNRFTDLKNFLEGNFGTGPVYMKTVPNDPRSGTYYYFCGLTDYKLIACLENAADTKKDSIKDTRCTTASITFTAP